MHTKQRTRAPKSDTNTHVRVESVRHELKLAIGRDEGDGTVVLKTGQTHTLVELDILKLHRFTLTTYTIHKQYAHTHTHIHSSTTSKPLFI